MTEIDRQVNGEGGYLKFGIAVQQLYGSAKLTVILFSNTEAIKTDFYFDRTKDDLSFADDGEQYSLKFDSPIPGFVNYIDAVDFGNSFLIKASDDNDIEHSVRVYPDEDNYEILATNFKNEGDSIVYRDHVS